MSRLPVGAMGARAGDALWRRARTGSGIWLAAAIVVGGARLLRRWSKRGRELVFSSEVKPGERLTIHHLPEGDDGAPTSAGA